MAGDKDEHAFILGYIYFKLKKGFLGLGTPRLLKWQEIKTTDNKQLVLDLIKYYFERNHEEFEFRFRWLELILEKEMQDMTSKNT